MIEILNQVCLEKGISIEQLLGKQRKSQFVNARKQCARSLRALNLSFPQIGKLMNRDHSSIIHYINPVPSHRPKRGSMDLNREKS